MKHLKLELEDCILERYPQASIHALIAEGVDRITPDVVDKWKRKAQQEVHSWHIDPQRLIEQPWISEWRSAIKKMGLNAAKKRSSIEQLSKRALAGDFIAISVPTVNLYCHVSIITRAPMGGYDCDNLTGTVRVRLSRPGDTFLGIGERYPIPVPPDVLVYADDMNVACFAWNHRDSSHTCLRSTTRYAVFFADACSAEGRSRADRAITLLGDALQDAGVAVLARGVLDSSTRNLALAADPCYRKPAGDRSVVSAYGSVE
jgi:DNA/RNA-binding domain of Phe-tRNA-synthetase-like protein